MGSVGDMAGQKRDENSLGRRIKRMVAEELAEGLAEDPDAVSILKRLGLIDEKWLADPTSDPGGPLRLLRNLGSAILEQPSLLAITGVESIDLLGAQSEAIADASPSGPDLAVVFTDLERFSSFTAESGDEAAGELLRSHYGAVDEIVAGRGGRVVKRLGDGHMVTFPTARSAVLGSLELVGAAPAGLDLRAGGHLGGVLRLDEDVVGHTVNVASRVAAATRAGHARVTQPVVEAAGDVEGIRFGPPIEEQLRGIDQAVLVCELAAA